MLIQFFFKHGVLCEKGELIGLFFFLDSGSGSSGHISDKKASNYSNNDNGLLFRIIRSRYVR